jgi:hypothetical protein
MKAYLYTHWIYIKSLTYAGSFKYKSCIETKAFKILKSPNASEKQLLNFQFIGGGTGIHWPELDEDLSLKGFIKMIN